MFNEGDGDDRLGDREADTIILRKFGSRVRRVPGGLFAMLMASLVTWGDETAHRDLRLTTVIETLGSPVMTCMTRHGRMISHYGKFTNNTQLASP